MDLRIFTEPQQGASYETLRQVAVCAEELGFSAFFRSDHYLRMGDGSPLPGPTDAWITLAGLARDTTRIRLGTLVTPVTFRFPGPLAISVAQVDQMSSGRVELGLGAGWFGDEHHAYGIPYPEEMADRFDMLEEQLAIVSGLWATPVGETFSFEGARHSVRDSPALPKPFQQPAPPIVMGGSGKVRTPRLAAKYAAEWNLPFSSLETVVEVRASVLAACQKIDRDPASIVTSAAQVLCCGADDAEIVRRAASIGREVDELRENGLCGTPSEIIERLTTWAEAGASRCYLQILDLDDLDHLRLVAAEVLPHAATL